jgi:PAS domain S-box-containing protein
MNKLGQDGLKVTTFTSESRFLLFEQWKMSGDPIMAIVQSTPSGICITDEQGFFEYVNPAYCAIYGYQVAELIGEKFTIVVPASQKARLIELHDRFIAGTNEVRGEWPVRNKSGEELFILADAVRIIGSDGRPKKVTFVTDITARKKAEDELSRSEALLREALIHQSRMAAVGEMIENIAHQWRQPLHTLGLFVQIIDHEYKTGELNQDGMDTFVKNAMGQIMHMSDTVDDFHNFFRPDKMKVRFTVQAEVSRTLSLLEATFQTEQMQVSTEAGEDQVVEGYPNEFCQVLLNIISNARDALKERKPPEPSIRIRIAREGDRVVVLIADNAGGIPEEMIGKVFDPYFTTKGPDVGTGVGLFMSKTIIEKSMGGSLTVRNGVEGAEFRIMICATTPEGR